MERVFVDTSAWFDLLDARSPRHRRIVDFITQHGGRLVTSSDVWKETVTLVRMRLGHGPASRIGKSLRDPDVVHLVRVEEDFDRAAWDLFDARPDKSYSMTDCTSFAIMHRMAIVSALTADRHFEQEGFRIIP